MHMGASPVSCCPASMYLQGLIGNWPVADAHGQRFSWQAGNDGLVSGLCMDSSDCNNMLAAVAVQRPPCCLKQRDRYTGCIPVFLGPPYNSMPLAYDVDYASIGVHFNITDTSGWLPAPGMHWEPISAESHPTYPQEGTWWVPDMDTSKIMIQVGLHTCALRRAFCYSLCGDGDTAAGQHALPACPSVTALGPAHAFPGVAIPLQAQHCGALLCLS